MSAGGFDFAGRNSHKVTTAVGGSRKDGDGVRLQGGADSLEGVRRAVAFYVPRALAHDFRVRLVRASAPSGGRLTATDVLAELVNAWVSGRVDIDGTRDAQPRGDRTRLTAYLDEGLARRLREACAEEDVSASEVVRRLVAAWVADSSMVEVP